ASPSPRTSWTRWAASSPPRAAPAKAPGSASSCPPRDGSPRLHPARGRRGEDPQGPRPRAARRGPRRGGGRQRARRPAPAGELVAQSRSTVLITGETGTGKELVARAIHDRSAQREMPLIRVNCAAIPESLLESELFGHVKGAFTGATSNKKGRFALADGGTIFLDEIGTLNPT